MLYSVRFALVICLRLRRFKDYGVYYVIPLLSGLKLQ